MFDGLYFEYPKVFSFILIFVGCASVCPMKLNSIFFPHTKIFAKSQLDSSVLMFFLKWLAITMFIFALMSPVKDAIYNITPKHGRDIVLVLDASGSMGEKGFDDKNIFKTRFDVVKDIVGDFIQKRKEDNLGLVVFGSFAYIASPLTYDTNILRDITKRLDVGIAGRYTALYTAIAQGVNLLKKSKAKSKIIIVLTDGYSTPNVDKVPLDILTDLLKKEHIKVYPIGIGRDEEYNKNVLIKLAQESGGVAFGARDADELKKVYDEINKLEKSDIKAKSFTYKKYYYQYPLFTGLLSFLLYVFLLNRRGRG